MVAEIAVKEVRRPMGGFLCPEQTGFSPYGRALARYCPWQSQTKHSTVSLLVLCAFFASQAWQYDVLNHQKEQKWRF